MYPPDGLLTLKEAKRDVGLDPPVTAPDPFFSGISFDAFPHVHLVPLTTTEELKMGKDETSGVNGRLRPRKSYSLSPQTKAKSKSEGKPVQDKLKRTTTQSKASLNKQNDFANKSDLSSIPQFLCPYCDKRFASKQTVSKHARRMHPSKPDSLFGCLFCNHNDAEPGIVRHMVDSHPNQYFACLDCHTRFSSTSELAEHKLNVCEKLKPTYRTKLRQKLSRGVKKPKKSLNVAVKDANLTKYNKDIQNNQGFNGIVISCELKPSQVDSEADIEDNITTNLILPPSKVIAGSSVLEKSAVIVLDDIQQWKKRMPHNFSFHNTDADQILSRLGVVQRSTRTESTRRDWLKAIDDSTQKFEKCFDTKFYSKVASNVQENMSKFLDGSFNFNPDPDSTIKTRKSKNSVVINTAEGFPILLACEQYSRSVFDSYLPRAIAPKHKWKWDNLENEKSLDQIKRDSHVNNCIITLISSLDIWTQLSMRQKFEEKFNNQPLEKKTEKQNILSKELKEILESRQIPTTSDVMKYGSKAASHHDAPEFPAALGLTRAAPVYELQPAVLSGEWVRPRCYVCCACGDNATDSKGLSSHIATQHPNAHVQYYEIVGEPLLNADILKHLYVPPSQVCNRTRPPRGFRECTKCRKSVTVEDLHQHMLDCAGDTPAVRRRQGRQRPFGVRRRRPRLSDNTIRKKLRKDVIRSHQRRQKSHIRPRPRIRTEVGDAETIRKMLADLPAKRHRVLVNPVNMSQRPRKKLDKQRSKLIMKKSIEEPKNIKRRLNKGITSDGGMVKSMNNDDPNKNSSSLEDDEDNKPLKPRLKTIVRRNTRQRESLNRQSMAQRAKRRSIRVEQRKMIEDNKVSGGSSEAIQEASLGDEAQKIDVKRGSYKTREHASRGATNGRDEQRPGCSGTSRTGNSAAPTQHAPLKHSIARLTADSETHDKSVQFHHLFLVQQECNNTNQHEHSGQHTLFENEAIVTRLDKPPLNYCQKGLVDVNTTQKQNKLNKPKPKKGLNDCIAMLKNKLVDPISYDTPGHVSVQCGNDDPIEPEPIPKIRVAAEKRNSEINDTLPDPDQNLTHKRITDISGQGEVISMVPQGESPIPNTTSMPKPAPVALPKPAPVELPKPAPVALPKPAPVALPKPISGTSSNCMNLREHTAVVKPANEVLESEAVPISPDNNRNSNLTSPNVSDLSFNKPFLKIQSSRDPCQPTRDVNKESQKLRTTEAHRENQKLVKNSTLVIDSTKTTWKNTHDLSTHSNIYPDCMIMKKQSIIRSETELNPQVGLDLFAEDKITSIPTDIPPAHASTHVESIISTPLDLSNKMDLMSNKILSTSENSYITDYDDYETLDLSKKYPDQRTILMVEDDEVVDLRMKPSEMHTSTSLDLCVKSTKMRDVSDIPMKSSEIENYPTDLSVRGKDLNLPGSDKMHDQEFIHDFTATKVTLKENEQTNKGQGTPSDLSVRVTKASVDNTDVGTMQKSSPNVLDSGSVSNKPKNELSEKANNENNVISATNIDTLQKHPVEFRKNIDKPVSKVTPSRVDKSHASKPIYDPTLKIPQYKIRATTSETIRSPLMEDSTELAVNNSKIPSSYNNSTSPLGSKQDSMFTPMTATRVLSGGPNISPKNRIESTTSVYTLANSCISVTKIESLSTTLTNALLSIPGSTIASTAPVYTLTGTTIATTRKYIPENDCHSGSVTIGNDIPFALVQDTALKSDVNIDPPIPDKCRVVVNTDTSADQDPETAKKIAMLPKELVDILGNMPVDHRNQLLNILPQYVSPSVVAATSAVVTLPDSKEVSPHTIGTAKSNLEPSNNSTPMIKQPSSGAQSEKENMAIHKSNSMQSELQQTTTITSVDTIQEINTSKIVLQSSKQEIDNTDELSTGTIISGITSEFIRTADRIIDLTQDEITSGNINPPKIDLSPAATSFVHHEKPCRGTLITAIKQKSNNDKTASLRAVRIKAPAERQKESQILKQISTERTVTQNIPELDGNEVNKNKALESNKSLAIQQAEVSSTQQHNKTTSVDTKYSAEVTSMDVESCSEEANVKSRRPSTGATTAVENNEPVMLENLNSKSIWVSSSIPTKNKENIVDENKEIIGIERQENTSDEKKSTGTNSESWSDEATGLSENLLGVTDPNTTKNTTVPSVLLEDEDSEDDIVLATIVRQKHITQKSGKNGTELVSKSTKQKTKGKKMKKALLSTTKKLKNRDSNSTVDESQASKSSPSKTKVTETGLENFHLENSSEGLLNLSANEQKKSDSDLHETSCTVLCEETAIASTGKDIATDQLETNYLEKETDQQLLNAKSPEVLPVHELPTHECATASASFTANKNIKLKEPLKRKRKQIVSDQTRNTTLDTTDSRYSNATNMELNEKSISIPKEQLEVNEKEEIILEQNRDLNQTKTSQKILTKEAQSYETLKNEFEDNTSEGKIKSLRRSRRGKSLYIEGGNSDHDDSVADVQIDLKTPLTKKQLIFSKLLLEEVNPPHSQITLSEEKAVVNDMPSQAELITNIDGSDETVAIISTEKCKSIKRKKSQQTKRKNKKKRSVDSFDDISDIKLTDKSLDDNKNRSESIQKATKKPNSENLNFTSAIENFNNNLCNSTDSSIFTNNEKDQDRLLDSTAHTSTIKTSSSEKRKMSNASGESKLKKTKLEILDIGKQDKCQTITNSEARVTTCYSAPVPARRTRSKSVVVKSSSEMYDPYDIDLEDMIDSNEPLRRSIFKPKDSKINAKSSKFKNSKELVVDIHPVDIDNVNKKEDEKFLTLTESCKKIKDNEFIKPTCDIKIPSEVIADDVEKYPSANTTGANEDAALVTTTQSIDKSNMSDSDDSSKSDVPLKKYVDERNKISELNRESIQKSAISNAVEIQNNNRYEAEQLEINVDNDNINVSNVTDEQLRSEQFMESFGFFSERKPRKSNLLATKKISETFHIIADESDDVFFRNKDRGTKKALPVERKKSTENDQHAIAKKKTKRGRKRKNSIKTTTCYCAICKKEFRRPDNYLRHQMTLLHVAKMSELELKVKTEPLAEEPNYLIAYKQHIDRLRMLTSKLSKRKKNSKTRQMLPSLEEILADVNKTVREQQLCRRGLSNDEALFLDCCELLKESHKTDVPNAEVPAVADLSGFECPAQSSTADLDFICKQDDKNDTKSDGDVDSITAKTILESEEVRNLENDLISGLKEAANANTSCKLLDYNQSSTIAMSAHEASIESFSNFELIEPHKDEMEANDLDYGIPPEQSLNKHKKNPEIKDKMYPDIEEIDMFEDKFDKIKRKCRSQAAAAKQAQTVVKPISGHNGRKKTDKKKGKKISKKSYQSTVLTKGALKGFEGIKVSIPTTDINISAIVPSHESSTKKKKKSSTKKKREKRDSETSSKYDSDQRFRDSIFNQKKVDVYEFMDNEDAELFEFRPSTLMERFKSISNKDTPSTSKYDSMADELEKSSESASDGDDFVYMSDDYVCSDDETENSLLSCELGIPRTDVKKVSSLKRKDAIEKNAVMGKIFKHNAVRSEKRIKVKDTAKPKANLDQLFDSLLEEEPSSSMLNNDSNSSKAEEFNRTGEPESPYEGYKKRKLCIRPSPIKENKRAGSESSMSPDRFSAVKSSMSPKKIEISKKYEFSLSTPKQASEIDIFGPSTSKKYNAVIQENNRTPVPTKFNTKCDSSPKYCDLSPALIETTYTKEKKKPEESYEYNVDFDNDPGVARQRARRKCTVGKQNVLAETWSSESEPDAAPARPNSTESLVTGATRKKKGRKRESSQSFGRRGKVMYKKQDLESRVTSNNRGNSNSAMSHTIVGSQEASAVNERIGAESPVGRSPEDMCPPPVTSTPASGGGGAGGAHAHGSKPRPRVAAYYWSSEGDDEQEHLQQHGWIVGDSHKKLVTMLAHAKGRKRSNDEKRSLVE